MSVHDLSHDEARARARATPALVRIASLKSVEAFRAHAAALGLELPCDPTILTAPESPLSRPLDRVTVNGKIPGNRWAVQPMEGWDAGTDGGVTDEVRRRWTRFGQSGAKLIWGGEAMAVRHDGRANPRQLVIHPRTQSGLTELRSALVAEHRRLHGTSDDLVIGFQLTHSGRFCRPNDSKRGEPRVAFRHPLLDRRFGVTDDSQVFRDDELPALVQDFVHAARVAHEAGADFVDIKHCHGYLLHEFLAAHTRPGPYGGSLENRTRLLKEIVEGIRADGNPVGVGVRVSAFDLVPFKPDPARSTPGKPGPGIPEDFSNCLPYRYAFGCNPDNPLEPSLDETAAFLRICAGLGVRLVNLSAGSPYYNPHVLRPAAYPPSDGYQPPEDPLIGVARQVAAVRILRAAAPPGLAIVGSGFSYLQEYLPHVAQALVREGWTDAVGIGRSILSYPSMASDCLKSGTLTVRNICRTFSDCTTAPRNGMVSGCYPLDPFYADRDEAQRVKALKRGERA